MHRAVLGTAAALAVLLVALLSFLSTREESGALSPASAGPATRAPSERLGPPTSGAAPRRTLAGVPPGDDGAEGADSGGDEAGGELRLLTQDEFLRRLRELGLGSSRDLFDRVHGQRADRGAVFVLVTNGDDDPVADARVLLDPHTVASENLHAHVGSGAYSDAVRRRVTEPDGVALFVNVVPQGHLLAVEHADYLTRTFGSIEPVAGERTFVEAVLEGAEATIAGVTTDALGAPLDGVRVTAARHVEGGAPFVTQVVTGFDGAFSLGVVAGSQSAVVASKLGYEDAWHPNVRAGTTHLLLVLEEAPTVTVRGFVTQGRTSEPVVSFAIDGEPRYDPQGRFEVERNVRPEPQALVFTAEGYEPHTATVTLAEQRDVDLGQVPLFGEAELSGVVLMEQPDGAPTPVAGAQVSVTLSSGVRTGMTTTAEGLFAFDELTAERVRLSVVAAGAAPYDDDVELLRGEPTYVEVLLVPGEYEVTGRILDADTEEPLEGARVAVVERPDLATTTGADGAYEIAGIPLERFSLEASHAGYEDEVSPALVGSEDGAFWEGRLTPSGLRIRFEVAGQPAPPGVPVTLWTRIEPTLEAALAAQQAIDELRFEELTDEDGTVTFDVEDGEYFVHVPAYRLHPTRVVASAEDSDWITLPLPGLTHLQGRVRNADGSPVANTSLWLHSGDQDYSTMFLYHTDESGRFSIPNLAPRPYALSIIKSVADQSAQHVREFFATGAPSRTLDITFPPLTASVSGRLTDEQGTGKPGVWIGVEYLDAPHRSILAGWVGTDADGRFHVPRLEPGRHILRTAWTDDEAVFSEVLTLTAGEHRTVDLVAPRVAGRRIRGHVLAADGGPLGPNFLFATDDQGRQNGNYFSTMDWAYVGEFELAGLRPGAYQVDVTAMGCVKQALQVSAVSDVSGLRVAMSRESLP